MDKETRVKLLDLIPGDILFSYRDETQSEEWLALWDLAETLMYETA